MNNNILEDNIKIESKNIELSKKGDAIMSSIDGIYNGINVENFSTFKMKALTKSALNLKKISTKIQKNIEAKTEILIKDDEIREIYFDEK